MTREKNKDLEKAERAFHEARVKARIDHAKARAKADAVCQETKDQAWATYQDAIAKARATLREAKLSLGGEE